MLPLHRNSQNSSLRLGKSKTRSNNGTKRHPILAKEQQSNRQVKRCGVYYLWRTDGSSFSELAIFIIRKTVQSKQAHLLSQHLRNRKILTWKVHEMSFLLHSRRNTRTIKKIIRGSQEKGRVIGQEKRIVSKEKRRIIKIKTNWTRSDFWKKVRINFDENGTVKSISSGFISPRKWEASKVVNC